MTNVYLACGFVLACIAFYRYGLPWLRRFDRANVERIAQQARDKSDANAHIRHALEVAEEQVEEIQQVKVGDITHFLFEAQAYSTREEAEDMRARRVGVIARRFYDELPAALMGRETPANLSARERASQKWKRTIH
jgi:hypothetical protein